MHSEKTRKKSPFPPLPLLGSAILLLALAAGSGCRPGTSDVGEAALLFRNEIQAKLTLYSAGLAPAMSTNDREKARSVLHRIYAIATPLEKERRLSLAILDKHGVTVSALSGSEISGTQNYGNYEIVSRVLGKRKPFQATLYLQGGEKIHIVCSPLIHRDKLVGVLIIGIDSEQLKKAGVTENEFMSLDFSTHARGGT